MPFVFYLLVIEDHFEEESFTLSSLSSQNALKWKKSLASFTNRRVNFRLVAMMMVGRAQKHSQNLKNQ